MEHRNYDEFKNEVNSHPTVKAHGDKLVSRRWNIFRDIMLMLFIVCGLALASIFILYPEEFKDAVSVSQVCDPIVNVTILGDESVSAQATCADNVCECNFPDELTIRMVNGS